MLSHYASTVFQTGPAFAGSFSVQAFSVGARANATFSAPNQAVDAGHSFVVGDKVGVWDGTTFTYVTEALSAVTATQLTWTSATPTIVSGDLLVNLGPDGGAGPPDYNTSKARLYKDPDGGTVHTDATVTTDSDGSFDFYHKGDGKYWLMVRDGDGTAVAVIPGFGGVGGRNNVVDFGAVGDGTVDDSGEVQAAITAATGPVYVPPWDFLLKSSLTLVDNTTIFGEGADSRLIFDQTGTPNIGIQSPVNIGDVTIRDLYIDHDGGTAASTVSCIEVRGGTGSRFRFLNLHIFDAGKDGIDVEGASGTNTDIVVDGCTIDTCDRHGISYGDNVRSGVISNNVVRTCNTVTAGAAIMMGATNGEDVAITGNVVETTSDNGIRVTSPYITVSGNTVHEAAVDGIRMAGDYGACSGNV
jgi:hypothetical protein